MIGQNIINISGINILLQRKNIKNINFSVSTTKNESNKVLNNESGIQVRVSAPMSITEDELLAAINSRVDWIHKKMKTIKGLPVLPNKKYISGENHYLFGKFYILDVIEQTGKSKIIIQSPDVLKMFVQPNSSISAREKLLNETYRTELKKRIPELIIKWQPRVGREVSDWGVKRMKTRWGTCNINKKRIWLNLELAKKPEACLEYVVVHEMTHLLERNHTARFKKLLDGFVPGWQETEEELNNNYEKGEVFEH